MTSIMDDSRFWQKVDKTDSCWNWIGFKTPLGYGKVKRNGRPQLAYRYCYEAMIEKVPDGFELDHVCRNPACVNPSHLEVVTHRTNILRGTGPTAQNARQTHCKNGHELTEENTYERDRKLGMRVCKICMRQKARRQYRSNLANGYRRVGVERKWQKPSTT